MDDEGAPGGTGAAGARMSRHRLLATVLAGVLVIAVACAAVVVWGVQVGPIDRPSLGELNALADKIGARCPESRYWGGNHVDVLHGKVRGPRLASGLTERELSLIDGEGRTCNVGPAIR